MRYTAVCTSMLSDRVESLDEGMEKGTERTKALEETMGSLVTRQDKLGDKVAVLAFDFNVNLKHHFQVIDFEAQMLSFSLNESVLVHQDWVQQNSLVQDQFGLHQDRISGLEETLRSVTTKVSGVCIETIKF
jgi:hypothetical protein